LNRLFRPAIFALIISLMSMSSISAQEHERMLADFNKDGGIFKNAKVIEPVDALHGKAAKIDKDNSLTCEAPGHDWNAFTQLSFEIFNPGDVAVRMQLMFKDDDAPHGYYSWINRYLTVAPGNHTIDFQISALRRGEGTPKDLLDQRPFKWDHLMFAGFLGMDAKPLYINNVRLSMIDVKTFAELKAFDFGPKDNVCFPGFTPIAPDTLYAKDRGHGWVGRAASYARHRAYSPDDLTGDWIADDNAVFQIDLPNGEYECWALMEDPGEWELYQNFTQRSLNVNGAVLADEKMSGKDFLDRYFHFAETEDLPGDSVWERYVAWRYPQRTASFTVGNGKADFNLRGSGQYAATLNTIAVWPKAKAADGKAFIDDVNQRRHKQLDKKWTEQAPRKETPDAALSTKYQAQGYIPFQRAGSQDIGYFSAPVKADENRIELNTSAAWGQSEPLQLAVHALRDLQGLTIKAGVFKSNAGDELPPAALQCGFVSYKFKRIGFQGQGLFGSVPFVVRPFGGAGPAGISAKAGSARQFWITVTVPEGQKGGDYHGSFSLSAQGAPDLVVPAGITVLPFTLPSADVGLGMFGTSPAPFMTYTFAENQTRLEADHARVIADLHAHGFTLYEIPLRLKSIQNGKVEWDFESAEKLGKTLRDAGLTNIAVRAEDNGSLSSIAENPAAAAKKYGFADENAILTAAFGSVNALCKQHGLPEPMFSFGDEPGTKPVLDKIMVMYTNVRKAGGVGTICYSMHEITRPLLDVLRISSLNIASLADFQQAQKAGNRVWLNNQGASRWAYGVYMWKVHGLGVEAYQQFAYNSMHGDPYYPFDSIEDDLSMVYPDREGALRPTVAYERIRAGINDYRTLLLLKTLCDKSASKGASAWAPVAKIIDGLHFEGTQDRRAQLSDAQLNELRATAVAGIEALSK
jgi:hypothetical protein